MDKVRVSVPWGEGRIAFMACKNEIEARLNEGWPAVKVYNDIKDKLNGLSYPGFTRSIRRYILGTEPLLKKKATENPAEFSPFEMENISPQPSPAFTAFSAVPPKRFFQKPDTIPDPSKLI